MYIISRKKNNVQSYYDNTFISILLRALMRIKDSKVIFNRTSSGYNLLYFSIVSDEVLLKLILESLIDINALNMMEIIF